MKGHKILPSQALDLLVRGNGRFAQGTINKINTDKRKELLDVQAPFAVIVTCSDSRIAPEIVFNQQLGDCFVVRVAGNVVGSFEMESIDYALKQWVCSVIIVMGHQNCGTVLATMEGRTEDIPSIAKVIGPSIEQVKKNGKSDVVKEATLLHAQKMKAVIEQSKVVSKAIENQTVAIHSAYYSFDTGKVTFF